jgi:hypothetical protein
MKTLNQRTKERIIKKVKNYKKLPVMEIARQLKITIEAVQFALNRSK